MSFFLNSIIWSSANIVLEGFVIEACRQNGIHANNVQNLTITRMKIQNTGSVTDFTKTIGNGNEEIVKETPSNQRVEGHQHSHKNLATRYVLQLAPKQMCVLALNR